MYLNEHQNLSRYFGNMVKELVRIGYRRGESVFGAPYDFRKAPSKKYEGFSTDRALAMSRKAVS